MKAIYIITVDNSAAQTPNGTYLTDMDGIRGKDEIVFMLTPIAIKAAMEAGAMITPKAKAAL